MDSILDSIKKNLGIPLEETHFDGEIMININANLSVLKQLGVGVPSFVVYDNSDLWSEFIEVDDIIPMATMFVYLKTKLIFDPPLSGTVIDAFKTQIAETEWRIAERMKEVSII